MQLSDVLGWIATILFSVCFIPQILKTYRTRKVDGLSFRLLLLSFVANIIALWYATLIKQPPLQIKYIIAIFLIGGCIYLYLKIYFKQKQRHFNE